MISISAPAKINLHLHITGRAENGYHYLDSLIAFTNISDHIHISENSAYDLRIQGDPDIKSTLTANCPEDQNLITRAAQLLAAQSGRAPNALIHLEKHIPLGGGLGGGSSDAASVLQGLNRLWGLNLSLTDLHAIASQMGSDIAACLNAPGSVIMRDTGNTLCPSPKIPELYSVLVNPRTPCPTPLVYKTYAAMQHPFSTPILFPDFFADSLSVCSFLRTHTRNDLTDAAIRVNPDISRVLKALNSLPDQLLTRLSGSGSTCYAIFTTKDQAIKNQEFLLQHHPDWWIKTTQIFANN